MLWFLVKYCVYVEKVDYVEVGRDTTQPNKQEIFEIYSMFDDEPKLVSIP